MDGDLLIAADVYYKLWEDAALWQDVFVNQWAFAVGTQLTRGQMKYRLGYSYNSNPINHNVGSSLDGFPVAQEQIQLFQAAAVPQSTSIALRPALAGRDSSFRTSISICLPAAFSRVRTVWPARTGVAGRVLHRHGHDLAVRRLRQACGREVMKAPRCRHCL